MVGVNLPNGRRRHCDRRWQSWRRHWRCRSWDTRGRSNRRRRQRSLLRHLTNWWQRCVLRHGANRRRWQRGLLRNRTNSRRRYGLRLRFGRTRICRLWRGSWRLGLASHKCLPDCIKPLSIGGSRVPLGRLRNGRSSRDRSRDLSRGDHSWIFCRRLRSHLRARVRLADSLLRRCGFSTLHLWRSGSRGRCCRCRRFLGGKQRLEGRRGIE